MFFSNLGISDSVSTPVAGSYFWYDPGNTDSYPGTGSTLYDLSGNGRNATVNGSPTHVSGLGGYFDFDGVNDYILSANAFNGGNNVHTLEVWIRTSALDECIWSDIGQTSPSPTGYHFSGCQINNISGVQDRIMVSVWNGSNPTDAVANAQGPAALDTWYQIVRVYDGTRVKGYSNGEFTSNGLPEPFDDPASAWYFAFGHQDSTDILNLTAGMFSGRYGTIRFYNRALSAGEIRKNYQATRPLYSYADPTIQTFTSTGTTSWTAPAGVQSVEYLVVGGGGGGGTSYDSGAGGGGGGGMVLTGSLNVTPGESYTVTVGAGGAGGPDTRTNTSGNVGNNSVFSSVTALGGGAGQGSRIFSPTARFTGGVAQNGSISAAAGGGGGGGGFAGAGGGGAKDPGGNSSGSTNFGVGGAGITSSLSGSPVTYGAGGNGGIVNVNNNNGSSGAPNTGNGGTAGNTTSSNSGGGGNGGSGIVILKYREFI